MIATSIEQSRRLLELGLSFDSADMFWMDTNGVKPCLKLMDDGIFNHRNYLVRFPNSSLPAWSLSALLKVMPKGAELTKMENDAHELYYEVDYMFTGYEDSNPITAAYEMVCWLLEQGLIEMGGQDD